MRAFENFYDESKAHSGSISTNATIRCKIDIR
jgi:hypothetical protein